MYNYMEQLPGEALKRYKAKLSFIGLDKCPYKYSADSWKNVPTQWPQLQYPDLFNYLITSPGVFTMETMQTYRSLEAYNFFVSGWVETVLFHKVTEKHVLLKADVKPSWRVTADPHHPWVSLTTDAVVIAAHCDCMAGLGETCSHVAALMFKVEAAVRMGYTSAACTDLPCQWNACFVSKVKSAPIAKIAFYKTVSKEKIRNSKRKKREDPPPSSDLERKTLLQALAETGGNIVGLSAFADFNDRFVSKKPVPKKKKLPTGLRTLYRESNDCLATQDFTALCEREGDISITQEEINYVEEVTQAQTSSLVWHDLRAGRITGSTAHGVLHTSVEKPAQSIIKKICIPSTRPLNVPAVNWGQAHENDAFEIYTKVMAEDYSDLQQTVLLVSPSAHRQTKTTKAGFVISKAKPMLGASPDGFVDCGCCGKGVIEIKCPYSHRNNTIKEACVDKNFILDEHFNVKTGHQYFSQIQMEMYVSDATYTDLVIWTTTECLIQRIPVDQAFVENMTQKLVSFWRLCILPELLTRKVECPKPSNDGGNHVVLPSTSRQREPTNAPSDQVQLYCICRSSDESEQMVACDKCDEWFHLSCLKLKRVPKASSWYCKGCRKTRKADS